MRSAIIMAMFLAGGWAAKAAPAQNAKADQPGEAIYNDRMQDPYWKLNYTGEQFAWQAGWASDSFVKGYEATGNTSFLDWGMKYYDALIAKMAVGPDGYKGWIGPFEDNDKYFADDHVGDAVMFDGLLEFAWVVTRDPKLKAKYGAKALQYVKEAKRSFFEKWDSRGTWHEDGPYGVYTQWDKFGMPGEYKNWIPRADCPSSGVTLPFNKQDDIAMVALRIWQITGEEKYKQRAEKIFGYTKSRMQRYKDEYHWNYWEPGGQWDLSGTPPTRHWINTHGGRNYQSGEVVNIFRAYNAGIVFTEDDLRGILNTNLKVMWNGDEQKPLFGNSNIDLMRVPPVYGEHHAGELWVPLAQVDDLARRIYATETANQQGIDIEYFRNVTAKTPPSYRRQDVRGKVEIPQVYARLPLGNVRTVSMAAALPGNFASGEKTMITCKLVETGNLEVALYSPDGETKLATLFQGERHGGHDGLEGIFYFGFNGTDPSNGKAFPAGDYRVRWTVAGDGYREFPITIQRAKR